MEKSWNFEFLLRKMCSLLTLLTRNDTDGPPIAVKKLHAKSKKLRTTGFASDQAAVEMEAVQL